MYLSEDCGAVYVREKGELRYVSADKNDAPQHRLFNRDFSFQLCIDPLPSASHTKRRDHFIFTYNKEGSLRYSVKSLFDISLQFIADHIEHVDSLVGFPEQMADKLFSAAEERHKFTEPQTAPRALQVFCEAYGELVLKSLCLRNRYLLIPERLEEIRQFQSLECLDLYGCRLGDNHEVFKYITSEALASLVKLFIGANCLSDAGLQKLTAPVRVMKKGLENLQLLDVSENHITEKGLGYLTCFKALQKLDISRTNVTVNVSLKGFFRMKMGMVLSETPLKEFGHSDCNTEGWAEQVINQWEITASEVPKKDSKPRTNALRFYGREKFVRETLNSWSGTSATTNKDKVVPVHFYTVDLCGPSSTAEHNTHASAVAAAHKGKKRRLSEEEQSSTPVSKRQSFSALSVEDLDLLNSY
ncbi:leucine-rich repeat-containing protein 42 [Rhinichthys klamathensis goyatoka]|uniref:leucine-rich repeat-containing protein 42 n=1 Tax=Rhinichthys klamathensis goyatoka TaxID=3034132 RepID=UPI0024B55AA0|nr:leucine-rich repeat-containing protein 42 [Rhinichthys klamathensis goyatoka]